MGPAPSTLDQLLSLLPFVDEADPTLRILIEIRFRYFDILSALGKASSAFTDAPAGGGDEDTGMAPAFVPQKRDGTFRITPYYLSIGALSQVHCLVHESAHFVSDAFQDFAYRDRSGAESDDPDKYKKLPVQFAIRNADSYAYFALQMAKGIDRILSRDE
ncbi:hypothetical protein MPC1_6340003 [Methylocella tundrae]|nr:hypothetical protein MPC1_6340003 [Methylocella tundrae]